MATADATQPDGMRAAWPTKWRAIGRTVAITATLTSAFWVLLGAWLYLRVIDHAPTPPPRSTAPGAGLAIPVTGVRADQLTDTFAQARAQGARRHDAIDIMAPEGTPVVAAASGRVEKLFLSGDGGKTVYLRSADGRMLTYYAHLAAYAPGLVEGAQLAQGAPIGTVGHTGNASAEGPHLHFAVMRTDPARKWYEDAEAVDPYPLLGGR